VNCLLSICASGALKVACVPGFDAENYSVSAMTFHEITTEDVPALFDVRTSVRENIYTRGALLSGWNHGKSSHRDDWHNHCGWLCEADSKIVGFAMANGTTGEFWVIAVLPEYEGQGIGSKLLRLAEDWLWSVAWKRYGFGLR